MEETVVIENYVSEKGRHKKMAEGDEEKVTIGQKTIEEVVNEIAGKPTIWSILFVIVAMSYGFSVDSLTYLTVFAGLFLNRSQVKNISTND